MASVNTPCKSSPREAQIMAAILKDMGVNEYEPRVLNQMMEFSYRKHYVVNSMCLGYIESAEQSRTAEHFWLAVYSASKSDNKPV